MDVLHLTSKGIVKVEPVQQVVPSVVEPKSPTLQRIYGLRQYATQTPQQKEAYKEYVKKEITQVDIKEALTPQQLYIYETSPYRESILSRYEPLYERAVYDPIYRETQFKKEASALWYGYEKEIYAGEVPSWVQTQIVVPSEFKFVGAEGLYTRIAYEKYLGLDVSKLESEFESVLKTSRWFMETQPVYKRDDRFVTFAELKVEEPALFMTELPSGEWIPSYDVKRWKAEQWEALSEQDFGGVKQAAQAVSAATISVFDPGYWVASDKALYMYEKEYGITKQIESGDVLGAYWKSIEAPYMSIVIPGLAGAAMAPYLMVGGKALTGVGTSLVAGGHTVAGTIVSYTPYIMGGVGLGAISAGGTATWAMEEKGLLPQGTTLRYGAYSATAIASAMAGGYVTARPSFIKSLTMAEQKAMSWLGKFPGAEWVSGKVYGLKLSGAMSRFNVPTMEPFFTRFKTGISRILSVSRLQTYVSSRVPYDVSKPMYLPDYAQEAYMGFGYRSMYTMPRGGYSRIAGDTIMGKKPEFYPYEEYPGFAQPSLETHLDIMAFRQQLRFKLGFLKQQDITTESVMFFSTEKPSEVFFLSKQMSRDVYSVGRIDIGIGEPSEYSVMGVGKKGGMIYDPLALGSETKLVGKASGVTYYKLRPSDVFWQEKPFVGKAGIKYVGDIGEASVSVHSGLRTTMKEIGLYGYWDKSVYLPSVKDVSVYSGVSAFKSYPQMTYIERGFLKQFDISFMVSKTKGVHVGRIARGKYMDTSTIFKISPKDKPYFFEPSGFDTRGMLVEPPKLDVVLPGGVGVELTRPSYPRVIESMYKPRVSLSQLEFLETGIVESSFWTGVKPKPSIGMVAGVTPMLSFLPTVDIDIVSKTSLDVSKELLSTQISVDKQLESLLSAQGIVQTELAIEAQLSKTRQLQAQLQLQQQKQLQLQQLLTPTITLTISQLISPPVTIPIVEPVPETIPPYVITTEIPSIISPTAPFLLPGREPKKKRYPRRKKTFLEFDPSRWRIHPVVMDWSLVEDPLKLRGIKL